MARKVGRPSSYDPKLCDMMLKFFMVEDTREVETVFTGKNGQTFKKLEEVSNRLPTFAGFSRQIGVHRETLLYWADHYPEFSDAYKKCKELQEEMLVNNALRGFYNPAFSIFFAKNNLGYRDKTETEVTVPKDGASELAASLLGSRGEEKKAE